ncbi:cupin-like domain-containing protein [Leptothoe sp. EHU-05/26/07-4]
MPSKISSKPQYTIQPLILAPISLGYNFFRGSGIFSWSIVTIGQWLGKNVRRQLLVWLRIITPEARNLLEKIEHQAASHPRLKTLNYLKAPTAEIFQQNYSQTGKPVVITESVGQEVIEKWSFDILKNTFGKTLMLVRRGQDYDTLERYQISLEQYIDSMLKGTQTYYLGNNRLPQEMYKHVPLPSKYVGVNAFTYERAQLWIGGKATGAHLHRDLCDNFVLVLNGTKTFYLASPDESDFLYTWETRSGLNSSKFSAVNPNYQKFPLAKQAHFINVTLQPGELLYIPCGWFHQVVNKEPSCSINFFGRPLMATAALNTPHY